MWRQDLEETVANPPLGWEHVEKAKIRKVKRNVDRLVHGLLPNLPPAELISFWLCPSLPWRTGRFGGSFLAHADMILLKHGLEGRATSRTEGLCKNYLIVFY